MVALYKQFRCSIVAVEEVPVEETHKYGVIAGEVWQMAYKFKGKRFDCGSVEGFIEATNYCFKNVH